MEVVRENRHLNRCRSHLQGRPVVVALAQALPGGVQVERIGPMIAVYYRPSQGWLVFGMPRTPLTPCLRLDESVGGGACPDGWSHRDRQRTRHSSELHERIFELNFSRRATRTGKLGFGLWWVRTMMKRLGGTINVVDDYQHGASFVLRLPCQADGEEQ
jgi:hypothetical protein